jgi:hypothetical protein
VQLVPSGDAMDLRPGMSMVQHMAVCSISYSTMAAMAWMRQGGLSPT